jgi:hypothetical protein
MHELIGNTAGARGCVQGRTPCLGQQRPSGAPLAASTRLFRFPEGFHP